MVDLRINETLQIDRRCFQSRFIGIPRIGTSRFNPHYGVYAVRLETLVTIYRTAPAGAKVFIYF